MSKKALGKGIGALLGEDGVETGASALEVPLAVLRPNPHQPRQAFSEQSLRDLADSIREKGILQPILVEADDAGAYTIIAGERRVRAARLAGLAKIPVIVRTFSPQEKLEIALVENVQREDLTPMETAAAYRRLMDLAGLSQEQLAQRIGKERSTVANMLRLLKLPDDAQAALGEGTITAGHARALLMLVNPSDVTVLLKRIVQDGLSVRDAEDAAASLNQGRKGAGRGNARKGDSRAAVSRQDPHLRGFEQDLIEKLGTKVEVRGSAKSGHIGISWYSTDDLERLIALLK
jgi:ParB family transcriptional regulator, chromosome partitioning protein